MYHYYIDASGKSTMDESQKTLALAQAGKQKRGEHVKLVSQGYFPDLHMQGVPDDVILNMFDVFQHATDVKHEIVTFRTLPEFNKGVYHLDGLEGGMAKVTRDGRDYGQIVAEIELNLGRVASVNWLSNKGEIVATDDWDIRGFKSATRYYQNDGQLSGVEWFTPSGEIAAKASYMWQHIDGQPQTDWPRVQTSLEVMDYNGEHLWFNNETEAYRHFLKTELEKNPGKLLASNAQ